MKNSVTFSASPSFAALRLLAFDSSTPEILLAPAQPSSAAAARSAHLALPGPCHVSYALRPIKKEGMHYLYNLQIRDQPVTGLSCLPEAPSLLTRVSRLCWAGDS